MAVSAILDGKDVELGPGGDPEQVSRAILERILEAETADDIFRPQTLSSWRECIDRPAQVYGFHLNRSTFEGSEGRTNPTVYAVVDLEWLDDGERESVTCGGRNVMMQLIQAMRHNLFPVKVKLTANRTAEGYQALWLEAV